MRHPLLAAGLTWLLSALALAAPADLTQADLFVSGKGAYHTHRIPALCTVNKTVLAFCEGRKNGRGDSGDIDLLLRRSTDGGKTWGPVQVIADDGPNTVGNPCPVVDRKSGTIWLLLTQNLGSDTERTIRAGTSKDTRRVWVMKSSDEGLTWSKPIDVTRSVKKPTWTWYATGPGCGIQLSTGRLLVPCDHTEAGTKTNRSHVIYSDDGGATWKLGGVLGEKTNECQVVERSDGSLLLNMRSYHGKNRRALATSKDGGLTWSPVTLDEALIEPVCQASLLRYDSPKGGARGRLLFANPASARREKLTLRLSDDDGKTWPVARRLHEGPSADSALTVLPDGNVGCLYERGRKSPYETLTFARFGLGWLTDAKR
jgi:sialidase-1